MTKETDERVRKSAEKLSISRRGMSPWNKGKKGLQVAWNKGLTKEDPRVRRYVEQGVRTRKLNGSYDVPWNKGKHGVQIPWNKGKHTGQKVSPLSGTGKGGYREDLGHYVRSRWEANVCRILNFFGIPYEYEPKLFTFPKNSGNYRPDLYLPNTKTWVEIKGYWRKEAKIKIELFRKYYPNERFLLIEASTYRRLVIMAKTLVPNLEIGHWERYRCVV